MRLRPSSVALVPLALTLLLLPLLAAGANAQPRFSEVSGHAFGERITQHHEMVAYLEALADTSNRVSLLRQGRSWEGRELLAAVVTSPLNQEKLARIQEAAQRLADPRVTSPEEAAKLIETHPIVLWMGGSIHGNELSGSEGLLRLLEQLATEGNDEVERMLDEAVVIIDPMLNPDGRDAFAMAVHRRLGANPEPERDDWGHDANRWEAIGYRTGHYHFDTNRDWFAHTQAETRARVPTLVAWRPQVIVDAHEMGADVEFYFDPAAEPFGALFPAYARRGFELFGNAYASAFDEAGFEYMTGERFNFFYPGYTTSYGSYQGAVGMLYEQASTRGLAITRADGSIRTLGDALGQQHTAAWAAVETAVENRKELLLAYYEAGRKAVGKVEGDLPARYLIPPEGDPRLREELVQTLVRNGIEVGMLTDELRLNSLRDRAGQPAAERTFPPGTFVVEAAQPKERLVRVLLEPEQAMEETFLAEARRRVVRGENPRFYDMTSWSLPLLFDLPAFSSGAAKAPATLPLSERPQALQAPPARAGYAYLFDGGNVSSLAVLHKLKGAGHRASVLLAPSQVDGESIAEGSVVVRVGQNDESIHGVVANLASRYGVDVRSLDTGLADRGFPSLGSGESLPIDPVTVGLVAEHPVDGYSFGWAWYTLDQQYEIPSTILRAGHLHRTPLDRFDTLVIPDLSSVKEMARTLRTGGIERLQRWVRDGGTLVVIGDAVELGESEMELLSLQSFYPSRDEEDSPASDAEMPQRFTVPGAFLRAETDEESWLTVGLGRDFPVLTFSSRIFLPPAGPPDPEKGVAAQFAAEGPLRLSGHVWPESLERLPGAVFAYHEEVGRGRVVALVEDVNFRGYWRGADRLFLNAVLLGPSLSRN